MAATVTTQIGVGSSLAAANILETASFTPTGTNKVLYALVGSGANAPSDPSSVRYASTAGVGGETFTLLNSVRTVNTNIKTSIWKLVNPSAASGSIHCLYGGVDDERWIIGVAVQDAAGTEGTIAFATANNSNAPVSSAVSTSGQLVLDFLSVLDGGGGGRTLTCDATQTSIYELEGGTPATGGANNISVYENAGISRKTATTTLTPMRWTVTASVDWGLFSFAVNDAVAGSTTFLPINQRQRLNNLLRF